LFCKEKHQKAIIIRKTVGIVSLKGKKPKTTKNINVVGKEGKLT